MKRLLFLLLVIISLSPFHARASHVLGAEMSYKWLRDSTYQITLTLYGNCSGVEYTASNILKLETDSPYVHIFDSTISSYPLSGLNLSIITLLPVPDSMKDVSPYCPALKDSNSCSNPLYSYAGIERYVYSRVITLPHRSRKWVFEYVTLESGCANATGRQPCSNIYDDRHNNVFAMTTLNNLDQDHNSTPAFNTSIYPYIYSTNVAGTYTENLIDPDNDVLSYYTDSVYEITDVKIDPNGCFIPPKAQIFNQGYYVNNPLDTAISANSYSFSTTTGNMSFTPVFTGYYAITTRIVESRNGIIVGTTLRQITLLFEQYGGGLIPGHIENATVTGATIEGVDSLYACPGNIITFQAPIYDSSNGVIKIDSIQVSFLDIIGGSNVTVDSNNTTTPKIGFSWNTTGAKYGVYTLNPTFHIKSCPLPSTSSHTYTIIIGDAGIVTATPLSPTYCLYKAKVAFNIQNGYNGRPNVPYKLTLTQGADTLKTYSDTASNIYDSLATGSYTLILQSQGLPCTSHIDFTISDSGPYPYKPTGIVDSVEYCKDGKDSALVAHLDSNANYLKWYESSLLNVIPGPVTPATAVPGTYIYYVSQVYKTCESAVDTIVAIIDQNVCDYDVNIHNVITPNGDGHNDVWEIENLKFYPDTKVEIFDKLGDKVYEKTHYAAPWWDGGSLPSGVYYYTVDLGKPNIVTGKQRYTGYIMIKR